MWRWIATQQRCLCGSWLCRAPPVSVCSGMKFSTSTRLPRTFLWTSEGMRMCLCGHRQALFNWCTITNCDHVSFFYFDVIVEYLCGLDFYWAIWRFDWHFLSQFSHFAFFKASFPLVCFAGTTNGSMTSGSAKNRPCLMRMYNLVSYYLMQT